MHVLRSIFKMWSALVTIDCDNCLQSERDEFEFGQEDNTTIGVRV